LKPKVRPCTLGLFVKLPNTAHNKGYNAAPEYRLGLRHIAQKAAQRRIAKTLCGMAKKLISAVLAEKNKTYFLLDM